MNKQASQLRAKLLQAQKQLADVVEELLAREPLLLGSLYSLRRKCGKKNCRCARGELHESTVLSYRGEGRPRNVSPAAEQIESLRKLTDDYRRCRQARAKLVRLQRELLAIVDELTAERVQQGEAEFRKLRDSDADRKPRRKR